MDIETGLDNLLQGRFDAALTEFEGCRQQPGAEKLCELTRACAEISAYAAALAEGDLSVRPPQAHRNLSTHLESLHAKLKRLARQLLIFSAGYPMPAVDDMGDLSDGLTFLINQAQTCKKQVEHDQNHDVETGLMNRRAFVRGVREPQSTAAFCVRSCGRAAPKCVSRNSACAWAAASKLRVPACLSAVEPARLAAELLQRSNPSVPAVLRRARPQ